MPYDLTEHRHRYAAWAASRAASQKNCRFKVQQGKDLIESIGLREICESIDCLPIIDSFEDWHRKTRCQLIQKAEEKFKLTMSHGIAAKLINTYLKSIFLCGYFAPKSQEDIAKIGAIHPPVDRLLLNSLYKNNFNNQAYFWREYMNIGWSNFDSDQYEAVINQIRDALEINLWQIEEFWDGHQI